MQRSDRSIPRKVGFFCPTSKHDKNLGYLGCINSFQEKPEQIKRRQHKTGKVLYPAFSGSEQRYDRVAPILGRPGKASSPAFFLFIFFHHYFYVLKYIRFKN
jgi:hypothetical protein